LSSSSQVKAGHKASFVIWIWSTKAASTGISVKAHIAPALFVDTPKFSVCPVASGATCKVGNLPVGQADELQATVQVRSKAALGEQVQISAKASAKGALSFSDSATDVVVVNPTTSPTNPLITLPASGTLPTISGTGISPTDPSGLFPTVGASPTPSGTGTGPLTLPPAKPRAVVHAATAAATVPLDARLIGGQLAGLAVLAGAVTIAVARLSLRAPKPSDDKSSGDSSAKQPPQQ
jgi:hypothetical protein